MSAAMLLASALIVGVCAVTVLVVEGRVLVVLMAAVRVPMFVLVMVTVGLPVTGARGCVCCNAVGGGAGCDGGSGGSGGGGRAGGGSVSGGSPCWHACTGKVRRILVIIMMMMMIIIIVTIIMS